MNMMDKERYEPFKLLRDGNWVLNAIVFIAMIVASTFAIRHGEWGAFSVILPFLFFSGAILWINFIGNGSGWGADNRLIGKSFIERIKIGLMWK